MKNKDGRLSAEKFQDEKRSTIFLVHETVDSQIDIYENLNLIAFSKSLRKLKENFQQRVEDDQKRLIG